MSSPRPLLVEKYRPKTLEGYVFQDKETQETVMKWIKNGEIPNILLTGGPGSGKSTLARILINEFGIDPSDVKKGKCIPHQRYWFYPRRAGAMDEKDGFQ